MKQVEIFKQYGFYATLSGKAKPFQVPNRHYINERNTFKMFFLNAVFIKKKKKF